MCEFKVLKNNKVVFKDAIYAKADGNNITVKDVLGITEIFRNCIISEIDVGKERLVLTSVGKR